jgi:serine/threonine-protein kinase HipA
MKRSRTTIEIFDRGQWLPAADLLSLGDDKCRLDYRAEYLFGEPNPLPIALGIPLGYEADHFESGANGSSIDRRPPSFLYDLVPQGKGRRHLVDRLQLADADSLVMPLLFAGAFNPIGCLRLASAVEFFRAEGQANPDPVTADGFAIGEVMGRSEAFLEHLSLHAMLASGTTGVQGVAPKFLLTTNKDGRWFADMALPDDQAHEHWLLKLPRGKSVGDRKVLRNEAAYLRVAQACGIRTHQPPQTHGEVLFVRRFDRQRINGQLHRLHQESLASVCGMRGFGRTGSQQMLLNGIRSVVADPLQETIEFMKRDVLNQALRNTDNHARNTAVQRLPDGNIQLTPLFDFAPMFMDEEIIPRSFHWRAGEKRQDSWVEVLETLEVSDSHRAEIAAALSSFSANVASLPETAKDCGVEKEVLDQCMKSIEAQSRQLDALAPW